MRLSWTSVTLTKRHPLTISRGTITGSTNVVVRVDHDGVIGLGEMAPSDVTGDDPDSAGAAVSRWNDALEDLAPTARQAVERRLADDAAGPATRAALDMALHDWLGRRAGLPLWQLLGGDRDATPPTSLTIGIDPPDVVRERVPEVLARTGARVLKVKLGQPGGADADRDLMVAAQEAAAGAGFAPAWRVDANGGWDAATAAPMIEWLAGRGVELVEQPLAEGDEDALPPLVERSPLPVYLDESIRTSADVARFADRMHGANLKLMKCGGITEAMRIVHVARAHGLGVMIGCMGESSLSIAAGAQVAPFVDHVDLDSHLNLIDDPFVGVPCVDGVVRASDGTGLGVEWVGAA